MVHVPKTVPAALRDDVGELLSDMYSFFSLLKIQDKTTKQPIPFEPNHAQRRFLELAATHNRIIVVKARQVGISTAMRAYHMWRAYIADNAQKYAVLSFHDRSAKNLRKMDGKWLKGLPTLLQRKTEVDNTTDFEYADTGAGLSAYTTGGRGGTRSFSFSAAHLSEFDFYVDGDETLAEVLATVGQSGQVVIESTVNKIDGCYARLVAGTPHNGWALYTYWWWEYPEHVMPTPDDFAPTELEQALATRYDLSDEQLMWRRSQLATLGEVKFRREYPACMDDAFAARDSTWISAEAVDDMDVVPWTEGEALTLEPPQRGDTYVMGVDTAGGTGGDYATLCVVSKTTRQPVYVARSNTAPPHIWGQKAVEAALRYNNALILCESNNHGHSTIREMSHTLRYRKLWVDSNSKHWVTTVKSKVQITDLLREYIVSNVLCIVDSVTVRELRGLVLSGVAPAAQPGGHDDMVMAYALAYWAIKDTAHLGRDSGAQVQNRMSAIIEGARAKRIRSNGPFGRGW